MDEQTDGYSIGSLAKLAQVTERTIRYYVAEGLLPTPEVRGRYAVYTDEHLERLKLIARLKEAYLPLGEIRARLANTSLDQVRELLAAPQTPIAPPSLSSASDYIMHVLRGGVVPMREERAAEYGAVQEQEAEREPRPTLVAPPAPTVAPPAPMIAPMPAAPARTPLLRRLGEPNGGGMSFGRISEASDDTAATAADVTIMQVEAESPQTAPSATEQWSRIQLADGMELHIREPRPQWFNALIEQIRTLIRQLSG